MAKRTKSDKTKLALRRLAEDEQVQAELRTAAIRLHEAWGRVASKRPRSKAVEDKKLYDKLREAATSLTQAARRIGRKPEPPKRHGRKVVLAAAGAGGVAFAAMKKRQARSSNGSQPVAEPSSTQAVAG